jgi:hypothetical protein
LGTKMNVKVRKILGTGTDKCKLKKKNQIPKGKELYRKQTLKIVQIERRKQP